MTSFGHEKQTEILLFLTLLMGALICEISAREIMLFSLSSLLCKNANDSIKSLIVIIEPASGTSMSFLTFKWLADYEKDADASTEHATVARRNDISLTLGWKR